MSRGDVNNGNVISIDELRNLIRYEPDTGRLFWLSRPASAFSASKSRSAAHVAALWNSRYAGTPALDAECNGYRHGHIGGRIYRAHRVCVAIHYGRWPNLPVDHINGDKSDNRICNLREATRVQNGLNRGLNFNNTSGCRGVSWVNRKKTWAVRVSVPGVGRKTVGYFKSYEKATEAYMNHAKNHHEEYFAPASVPMSSLTGGNKAGEIGAAKGKLAALDARLLSCR